MTLVINWDSLADKPREATLMHLSLLKYYTWGDQTIIEYCLKWRQSIKMKISGTTDSILNLSDRTKDYKHLKWRRHPIKYDFKLFKEEFLSNLL